MAKLGVKQTYCHSDRSGGIPFHKLALVFMVAFFLLSPLAVFAADALKFSPRISIPGSGRFSEGSNVEVSDSLIGDYISAFFNFAVPGTAILAVIMMMYGGIMWLTSGGSMERIGKAKEYITGAISGMVLLLASFIILNTISPDLVTLGPIGVTDINRKDVVSNCCVCRIDYNTAKGPYTETQCKEISGIQDVATRGITQETCSPAALNLPSNWRCDGSSGSCTEQPFCKGTLAGQSKACTDNNDSQCSDSAYICNMAERCDILGAKPGQQQYAGCCRTKGNIGDKCDENADCNTGKCGYGFRVAVLQKQCE